MKDFKELDGLKAQDCFILEESYNRGYAKGYVDNEKYKIIVNKATRQLEKCGMKMEYIPYREFENTVKDKNRDELVLALNNMCNDLVYLYRLLGGEEDG